MAEKPNYTKIAIIVVFCLIIFAPASLHVAGHLSGRKFDVELNGYTDTYKRPSFSTDTWVDGRFQNGFMDWINNNLTTRGVYIKSYNQIRYSLFNVGNRIIGKNKDVFEEDYVNAQLCLDEKNDFTLKRNQEKMQEYVNALAEVNEKLHKQGKALLFYITPSKTYYHTDNIPARYFAMQKSEVNITGYEYLRSLLKNTDITYLDTHRLSDRTVESASFYHTGIHWSRTFEQIASVEILRLLSEELGTEYKIKLGKLNKSQTPYWRDNDVQELLNIYTVPKSTYYEYSANVSDDENAKPLSALLQGGSFASGIMHDYFDVAKESSLYYINYKNYVVDSENGKTTQIDEWDDVDFQTMLDRSDVVIIEINDAVIANYSDGFVQYLNSFLDTYVPGVS